MWQVEKRQDRCQSTAQHRTHTTQLSQRALLSLVLASRCFALALLAGTRGWDASCLLCPSKGPLGALLLFVCTVFVVACVGCPQAACPRPPTCGLYAQPYLSAHLRSRLARAVCVWRTHSGPHTHCSLRVPCLEAGTLEPAC